MARAVDLDTIAPDDVVEIKKKKKKIVLEKKVEIKKEVKEKNNTYREKVYAMIKGKTAHPLSSFLARPNVFTFENIDEDEEIILVLRRHWFSNLKWIIVTIVMMVFPSVFSLVPIFSFFPMRYAFVFVIFWYLITFIFAFESFLSWYFNVFILTDERLIDIDFNNLIDKKYSEAKIEMIQDVSVKTVGVSQTMFNYGTVLVQTAAEIPNIVLEKIPSPNLVLKVLEEMRHEEEMENKGENK